MKLIGYDSDYYNQSYGSFRLPSRKKRSKSKKKYDSQVCCYCSIELNRQNYSKDHIHPKSLGGKITRPCCWSCNQEKSNMTLLEYQSFVSDQMIELDRNGRRNSLGYRKHAHKLKRIEELLKLKADQR